MVYLENYVVCTMKYFMEVFHLCRRTCHCSSHLNYGKTGEKTCKIAVPQHYCKASSKTVWRFTTRVQIFLATSQVMLQVARILTF